MKISDKKVGFTSVMKAAFIFDENSEARNYPNHVFTQISATKNAVNLIEECRDTEILVSEFNGEMLVLTIEEAKANSLEEITLRVVDKNTDAAKWVKLIDNTQVTIS